MRIIISKKDIMWSYISAILAMGANIIMLPFIMYYLDSDMLGLWYVFASIGTIATLFDFGFSVTFARNITYCWSGAKHLKKESVVFVKNVEPDFFMLKKVLVTCKIIYGILAGTAFLLLLTLGTSYILYITKSIEGKNYIIAWLIYSTAVFLNLYYGYYNSFLNGIGAVERSNKNIVIAKLTQMLLTVFLLFCNMGLIGPCVAYLAYGTIFRQLGKHYFYNYQDLSERLNSIQQVIEKRQIKELFSVVWHNAWRDGMISISNYLCGQASIIICSLYLSLTETGVYSIGMQIATAVSAIAGTLYNAYQPELQSTFINSDMEKMKKVMAMIVTSFTYLFLFGIIGVCLVGLPVLRFIKPNAVVSIPILLGLASYQFILKFRNCYASYFSCTNRILYLNGFLVSAILCVCFSFITVGILNYGIIGLIFAQIISQAIYNLWKWPLLANKELGLTFYSTFLIGTQMINSVFKRCIMKIQ